MSTGDERLGVQVAAGVAPVEERFQPTAHHTPAELAAAVSLSFARISQLLSRLKLPADIRERLLTDPALT